MYHILRFLRYQDIYLAVQDNKTRKAIFDDQHDSNITYDIRYMKYMSTFLRFRYVYVSFTSHDKIDSTNDK